jgi:hypothetical protein
MKARNAAPLQGVRSRSKLIEADRGGRMYIAVVVLLLLVLPAGSVVAEGLSRGGGDLIALVGKWFVFWGVGVRLFIAGIRQMAQPQFTAVDIFAIEDPRALAIVRELGFANLAVGTLGLITLVVADFRVPAAITGGLFYGLAGLGHAFGSERNAKRQTAMISDFFIFAVLAVFVALRGF